jgi:hypothetical protein
VQITGLVPVHVPFWHESVCVHALPSLHGVPFAAAGLEQAPVLGLHVPAVWQESLAAQTTRFEPVHTPDSHESFWVQAFPSLQFVPLASVGFEQVPLARSQVPAAWQAPLATQVTGFDPVHTPFSQVSVCVHAFPSLHVVPFAAGGVEHAPVAGLQVPATWQVSSAAQVTGSDPVQAPLWHVSLCVQALPSLQVVPLGASGLEHAPVVGSHVPAT